MSWARRRESLRSAPLGKLLLWSLSLLYGTAVLLRRAAYGLGLMPTKRLPAKVVCIGNLTTGGTGKTPTAILAAQTLRKRHQAVAILSRGYGRRKDAGEVTVLLDDNPPPWTECGDEPWMMHHALQGLGIPILVCADRAKAGHEAVTFYHSKILVMDDGFQHFKLQRDLDIVLINAADPFGGRRLLPLGDLREPLSALKRAKLVLLTHADRVGEETLAAIKRDVHAVNPKVPVVEGAHRPEFLLDLRTEGKLKLTHLADRKAVALSGLADPAQFEEQLKELGAEVAQKWRYPDHHPYTATELRSIEKTRRGMPVVTTFKDFTRFPEGWKELLGGEVLCLGIKLEILKGKTAWAETLASITSEAS